ncbi:MAG: CAP domain-containing protein [Abditibacteriota bacterium]|nr:CAP domain-containing protein [Abditibacteriota bacterium]
MKAAQAYAEKNPPDHDFSLSEPLCDTFGYHCVHTENLAWNFEGAEDTVQGWIDSPGHYQTMLLEGYDEVGVGAAENGCYALLLGISDMPRG